MDFDGNGFVSPKEAFLAMDIGKREFESRGRVCKEYFSLKDGLSLSKKCEKIIKADFVIIKKSKRELYLLKNGKIFKKYHIALGGNPEGKKTRQGDQKTPEGRYTLDYKKRDSAFFRAIHISYPNRADRLRAERAGVNAGGYIMIHGQKNGFGWLSPLTQRFDWTQGCIAVSNEEMREIWRSIDTPTAIEILP
jgi:murein L,D-transpeptidase YafK